MILVQFLHCIAMVKIAENELAHSASPVYNKFHNSLSKWQTKKNSTDLVVLYSAMFRT